MYLGRIVEVGTRDDVFGAPQHPYTRALLAAVPVPDPSRRRRRALVGEAPSRLAPPSGCPFHLNCPIAVEGICDVEEPTLRARLGHPGHVAACHLRTGDHQDLDPDIGGRLPA